MDPISDLLVRIANGYRARREVVVAPYSALKAEIGRLLVERGYLAACDKKGRKVRKFLELKLRYGGGVPALTGARRVSKPSRRVYFSVRDIRPVRQGTGLLILSTPHGVMSGEEARKLKVGGEAMAEVW